MILSELTGKKRAFVLISVIMLNRIVTGRPEEFVKANGQIRRKAGALTVHCATQKKSVYEVKYLREELDDTCVFG